MPQALFPFSLLFISHFLSLSIFGFLSGFSLAGSKWLFAWGFASCFWIRCSAARCAAGYLEMTGCVVECRLLSRVLRERAIGIFWGFVNWDFFLIEYIKGLPLFLFKILMVHFFGVSPFLLALSFCGGCEDVDK